MLLFDFDGTLMESNKVWEDIDHQFLNGLGLTATEEYLHMVGHSIFPIAAQITKDYYHLDLDCQEIMDAWLALAWEAYAHHIPMKEGVLAFLEQCKQQGEEMVLFTACVPKLCQVAMQRHNLSRFFSQRIYVQELGVEKRDPKAFTLSLATLGVAAKDCTLFDDSPSACATAVKLGLNVVAVHDSMHAKHEAELTATCNKYIHSFTQLLL